MFTFKWENSVYFTHHLNINLICSFRAKMTSCPCVSVSSSYLSVCALFVLFGGNIYLYHMCVCARTLSALWIVVGGSQVPICRIEIITRKLFCTALSLRLPPTDPHDFKKYRTTFAYSLFIYLLFFLNCSHVYTLK